MVFVVLLIDVCVLGVFLELRELSMDVMTRLVEEMDS